MYFSSFDEILEDIKIEKDVVGCLVEIVETISIACVDVDIKEKELEVLIIGASVSTVNNKFDWLRTLAMSPWK